MQAWSGNLSIQVSWVSDIRFFCSYFILHDCCELAFDTIQQLKAIWGIWLWRYIGIPWGNHRVQDCPTILSSRVPFCQEEKKILCESDWYWRSSTLASDQISYHDWATNLTGFSIEPDCDIFDRCERLIFSYYTEKNCPYRSELQFWSQINITLYEIVEVHFHENRHEDFEWEVILRSKNITAICLLFISTRYFMINYHSLY